MRPPERPSDPPYGEGEEYREWWLPGDPPEFRRYRSREEALARQAHFELHPDAVELLPADEDAGHPEQGQPHFWQASGLVGAERYIIRWEAGRWTVEGGRMAHAILSVFLDGMDAAGYSREPIMSIAPDAGAWIDAAARSARAAMPGPVVIDDNMRWDASVVY